MEWVSENWVSLLALWGAVNLAVSTVVKLTPTKVDDMWWDKIVKSIQLFSIVKKDKK